MDTKEIQKNSRTMSQELIWLDNLITERLNNYFKSNGTKYYSSAHHALKITMVIIQLS